MSSLYYARTCFTTKGEPFYRPLCDTEKRGKLFSWADHLLDVFPRDKRRRVATESYSEIDLKWCDRSAHLPIGDVYPISAFVDLALTDAAYGVLRRWLEPFGDFYVAKNISDESTVWLYIIWSYLDIGSIREQKKPVLCISSDDVYSGAAIVNNEMKEIFRGSGLSGLCFSPLQQE